MKKIILILAMVILAGCGGMTNEEIVKEKQFCEENGMDYDLVINGLNYSVRKVICVPKKQPTQEPEK